MFTTETVWKTERVWKTCGGWKTSARFGRLVEGRDVAWCVLVSFLGGTGVVGRCGVVFGGRKGPSQMISSPETERDYGLD